MRRLLAATTVALMSSAVAVPALAADAQVCLLTSTETLTPPRKPNILETELDCGAAPDAMQESLFTQVHNAMNIADAVEIMTAAGYHIAASTFRNSYTGHQIVGVYTLVQGGHGMGDAKKAVDDEADLPESGDDMDADDMDAGEATDDTIDDGPIDLE